MHFASMTSFAPAQQAHEISVTPDLLSAIKPTQALTDFIASYPAIGRVVQLAVQPLHRDDSGNVIQDDHNEKVQGAWEYGLVTSFFPREAINIMFEQAYRLGYTGELNKSMRNVLDKGETIDLGRTDLVAPDFSGLNMEGQFTAQHAEMFRADFTNTNLTNTELSGLRVVEPLDWKCHYENVVSTVMPTAENMMGASFVHGSHDFAPAQSSLELLNQEVEDSTGLLTDLANIIGSYLDPAEAAHVAMQPLHLDESGNVIRDTHYEQVKNAWEFGLTTPEFSRDALATMFSQADDLGYGSELNDSMAQVLARGDTLNLDNTHLKGPDFSNLDMTGKFSGSGASVLRPNFTGTIMTDAERSQVSVTATKTRE